MSADRGGDRMHRVRIGLTGLACVFLLVLLAAAFFGLTNREAETGPLVVADPAAVPVNANIVDTPREPLAELGVTPGFAGSDAGGNGAAPEAGPPPAGR